MNCTCRVCGNSFEYTMSGVGYDRELCGPICDGIESGRKSADRLSRRVLKMCKARNWSLHWTCRGAYLHLEASELIESLRGKRGDPLSEAADVLIVLMSITENAGLEWNYVIKRADETVARLESAVRYAGEEYEPSTPATDRGET